jgi:hypothetical protein
MKTRHLAWAALTALLTVAFLQGCAPFNRNWTQTNQTLHEHQYMVVGRVLNMKGVPIDQTRVYLLKRFYRDAEGSDSTRITDEDTEHLVVTTDNYGEFLITFDLLAADDVWLYIDAAHLGYKPRFVNLNQRLGDSIFDYPGHSPVSVHVVLEEG